MECNKDDASRAKTIAEEKLMGGDSIGAMRFALKAREMFPNLDGLSKLIEAIEIYICYENKIDGEADYYGILGVNDPLSSVDILKTQYKRRALAVHPDKNNSAGANGAFVHLSEAWNVLSDKDKRYAYDLKLNINRAPNKCSSSSLSTAINATTATHHVPTRARKPSSRTQDYSQCLVPNIPQARNPAPHSTTPLSSPQQPSPRYQNTCPDIKIQPGSSPDIIKTQTFWTCCSNCRTRLEYEKVYLNKNLLCPSCHQPFLATKMRAPSLNSRHACPVPSSNDTTNVPASASTSRTAEAGSCKTSSDYLQRKKDEAVHSPTDNEALHKNKSVPEKVEASGGLNKEKHIKRRRTQNYDDAKEGSNGTSLRNSGHKSTSATLKRNNLSEQETDKDESVSMDVPDADFHNFDEDRVESCFNTDQVWAAYDDDDGMPRLYAFVQKVISRRRFEIQIGWLNSTTNNKFGDLDWVRSGIIKTTGHFQIGNSVHSTALTSFSHPVYWKKGDQDEIQIFPAKEDIWAVYRNWPAKWNAFTADEVKHKYDVVVVLRDYNDDRGTLVAPLVKVPGFTSVFNRSTDPNEIITILREEMSRFSHQVPYHTLSGYDGENAPEGFYELDPAALPSELVQVVDAKVE